MTTEALTPGALADHARGLNGLAPAYPRSRGGSSAATLVDLNKWEDWQGAGKRCIRKNMAEIINLRQARKTQQRRSAAQTASENRARHGRTKGEKQRDRLEAERLDQTVEGARRTPAPAGETDENA